MVIYTNIGKVPLPEGWTLERAVEVLREAGHSVQRIEATDGTSISVPDEEKAA